MQDTQRQSLRTIVRGAYDIQKLRIQMGNRIVGNFKAKLGQEPSKPEKDLDSEGKAVLADLRRRYKKLTDGVKSFPRLGSFKGDEVISSYTELCLLAQYIALEDNENQHFRRLGTIVQGFPIWNAFLDGVCGVGPAMAGVIISEIDIHKARHPSSLWRYIGLDVSTKWILQSTKFLTINLAEKKPTLDLPLELDGVEHDDACVIDGGQILRFEDQDAKPQRDWDAPNAVASNQSVAIRFDRDGYQIEAHYRKFHNGGRSRRAAHLVDVT